MADRDTIFRLLMQHEGELRAFVGSMLRDRALADPHVAVRHAAVGSRHGELTG